MDEVQRQILQLQAQLAAHNAITRQILARVDTETREHIRNDSERFLNSFYGSGEISPGKHELLQFALAGIEELYLHLDEPTPRADPPRKA